MKINYLSLMAVFIFSTQLGATSARAADEMSRRESVEKIEKDIARDKEKVSSKKAEITTEQAKLEQDMNKYGKDSKEVRDDRDSLMNLRNDFVNAKTALYKDVNKKKVAEGQPVETESTG